MVGFVALRGLLQPGLFHECLYDWSSSVLQACCGELSGQERGAPYTLDICCSTPFGTGWNIQPGKAQPDTTHVHLIKSPVQLVELQINFFHVGNSAAIRLI